MATDGSTLTLTYPDTDVYWRRCHIIEPVTALSGDRPADTAYTVRHTNWPYHWEVAMGFDQPAPMGRMDQDMVFTLEQLWFPVETLMDQGWWIVDVTTRADGSRARAYGRAFVCRGNPLWEECPEAPEIAPQIVSCSTEGDAPPALWTALSLAGV